VEHRGERESEEMRRRGGGGGRRALSFETEGEAVGEKIETGALLVPRWNERTVKV
jgi:hypothetical protein